MKLISELDLLAASQGSIVAPAGCGKTELLINCLKAPLAKPALVLTHTNAGVAAIRTRLHKAQVPAKHCRVATIDGWALRFVGSYPESAAYKFDPTQKIDYRKIREVAALLLANPTFLDIIRASYSRLFVDEYQDCTTLQHNIVVSLASVVKTIVFGDPLQAIFGFDKKDPLPDWNDVVLKKFNLLGELDIPWRWRKVGCDDLGQWILNIREALSNGGKLELQNSCPKVRWISLSGNPSNDIQEQLRVQNEILKNNSQKIVVLGNSTNPSSHHSYARRAFGTTVVESVELKGFVDAAANIGKAKSVAFLEATLEFAASVMTGVNSSIDISRIKTLLNGKARKEATALEVSALKVVQGEDIHSAKSLLLQLKKTAECEIFRPDAYSAMLEVCDKAIQSGAGMGECAVQIREARRHRGRNLTRRSIGSTLLLKGLETDHVMILNADEMNAKHFYVAVSRGCRSVTIFSKNSTLTF